MADIGDIVCRSGDLGFGDSSQIQAKIMQFVEFGQCKRNLADDRPVVLGYPLKRFAGQVESVMADVWPFQ